MKGSIENWEVVLLLGATLVVETLCARYLPWGLYLDLPLVLCVYIGFHSKPIKGALCGVAFGWVDDVVLGLLLGLNGLSKTLLGFGAAYLRRWVVLEGVLAWAPVLALLTLLDGGLVLGLGRMLNEEVAPQAWAHLLLRSLVSGVAGALIFQVYDRIRFPRKDFRQR